MTHRIFTPLRWRRGVECWPKYLTMIYHIVGPLLNLICARQTFWSTTTPLCQIFTKGGIIWVFWTTVSQKPKCLAFYMGWSVVPINMSPNFGPVDRQFFFQRRPQKTFVTKCLTICQGHVQWIIFKPKAFSSGKAKFWYTSDIRISTDAATDISFGNFCTGILLSSNLRFPRQKRICMLPGLNYDFISRFAGIKFNFNPQRI